jgi:transposase-like protein
MVQADADTHGSTSRLTSAEKKELAELRRKNRQLEMDNDPQTRRSVLCAGEHPPK